MELKVGDKIFATDEKEFLTVREVWDGVGSVIDFVAQYDNKRPVTDALSGEKIRLDRGFSYDSDNWIKV